MKKKWYEISKMDSTGYELVKNETSEIPKSLKRVGTEKNIPVMTQAVEYWLPSLKKHYPKYKKWQK